MNGRAMLPVALVLLGAQEARADTWNSGIALMKDVSAQTCGEAPQVMWTLSLDAGTLSGRNNFGAKFSAPVGPDGAVTTSYTGQAGGGESFEMVLTGNARTRQLEAFNAKYSCRYRFTGR